ncbi:hypothetical protein NC651_030691 [Populus alba x Populus x berolinensis]|nr:hypothetical protein NC651_030691 [Populus alba x Populus x berolinensis]
MANPVPMLPCKSETTWVRSNTVQSMWGNASAMPLAVVPEPPPTSIEDAFTFAYNHLANEDAISSHGIIKEIVDSWILASVLPYCIFMGNTKCIAIIISEPSAQAIPWFCQNWVEHKRC